jgi:hypothetical protein
MGPGNALPAHWLAAITQPTLVLTGGNSPAWMTNAGRAVAGTIQGAVHRVREGQMHNVSRKRSLQSCSNSSLPEQRRNLANGGRWSRGATKCRGDLAARRLDHQVSMVHGS